MKSEDIDNYLLMLRYGIHGIGPKTALKIAKEFESDFDSNDITSAIKSFVSWWKLHHNTLTSVCDGSKFRLKLKKLNIGTDLPN